MGVGKTGIPLSITFSPTPTSIGLAKMGKALNMKFSPLIQHFE